MNANKEKYFINCKIDREIIKPTLTIITTVLNGAEKLENSILSIVSQLRSNIEYIIIDGGSDDGTIDIIKKYDNYINYWEILNNCGIYEGWNHGIKNSKGHYILFIGADDELLPNSIDNYLNFIKLNPIFDLICCKAHYGNRIIGAPWSWRTFKKYMNIMHVGSIHNRLLYEKYGLYNENYKIAGDYEFLLRTNKYLKALFLDLATVKMGTCGISSRKIYMTLAETRIAKKTSGARTSILCDIDYIVALLKYFAHKCNLCP